MKRTFWVCLLIFGLILSWSLVYAGDFYVIPVVKVEKKNYAPEPKTGQTALYYDMMMVSLKPGLRHRALGF